MTLKFNMVRASVKVHVHARFHQAKFGGSRVNVVKRKKENKKNFAMMLKTILSWLPGQ